MRMSTLVLGLGWGLAAGTTSRSTGARAGGSVRGRTGTTS